MISVQTGLIVLAVYLLIGLGITYFLLGIGYKRGGAPYHNPRKMIKDKEDLILLLVGTVTWLPFIVIAGVVAGVIRSK